MAGAIPDGLVDSRIAGAGRDRPGPRAAALPRLAGLSRAVRECLLTEPDAAGARMTVRGDCMDPELRNGQSVIARRSAVYLPGDIVVYHCPYQDAVFAHRFLGYVPAGGAWKCLIMADRASRPDTLVERGSILGRLAEPGNRPLGGRMATRIRSLGRYGCWAVRLAFRSRRPGLPLRSGKH